MFIALKGCVAATAVYAAATIAVSAATVTLDFGNTAQNALNYVEDGFVVDDARIVMGNCDSDVYGGSGPACMALNQQETSVITKQGGGPFSLVSFWFELFGGGSDNDLKVTSSAGGSLTFLASVYGDKDGQVYTVSDPLFSNVSWIKFEGDAKGNRRIDDIGLDVAAVPLPAAGWMLLAGLAGLGLVKRRKA
jgi:hypothetical protein